MTIEEKAKCYDEAIEIARALNSGKCVEVQRGDTVCECIFPEIKETEYERIKKQLIEFLDIFSKCGRNGNYSKWDTSDCANWLILVEKQKEHISTQNKESENMFPNTEDGVRRRSIIQVLEYARSLDVYNQYGKADIDKNIAWLEKQNN